MQATKKKENTGHMLATQGYKGGSKNILIIHVGSRVYTLLSDDIQLTESFVASSLKILVETTHS